MRPLMPLFTFVILAGCTAAPPPPAAYNPGNQIRLAQLLAGKVAGVPERCLPAPSTTDLIPIDGNHVAYRAGSTIYVSTTEGSCANLNGSSVLVTKPVGGASGPCRGDTAYVVDSSSGMTMGSCTFGDFIPYRAQR